MAFIAISNMIPKARAQWSPGDNEDKPDGGTTKPWVPKPPKKPHHCTDGHERIRVPLQWGGWGYTCERIKPGQKPQVGERIRQITGVRQVTPISGSDLQDRASTRSRRKQPYTLIRRIRTNLKENVENNP